MLIFKAAVDLLIGRHYNTNRNNLKREKAKEFQLKNQWRIG